MSNEALKRVASFTAANKKTVKKKAKKNPKQVVRKAHDKIEDKLDRLAKKYKVSIKLNRNKNKLPSVIVSGLKKLSYEDCTKLFGEIPNSSPVPQKMNGSSALFRIFTKRKVTASEDKFVVTAKRNGKRLYWTDEGFKKVKASDAVVLDEETADKIERRSKAKGWDSKSVPATMTADDTQDEPTDDEDQEDSSTDEGDDSDGGDEETDEEADANKADMVKFINDNNITRESLYPMADRAAKDYIDDLKENGPIEDLVGFLYDILGQDDAKNGLKSLVNKRAM